MYVKKSICRTLSMVHVVDYTEENQTKKLLKVDSFTEHFRSKRKELFQPYQDIDVDDSLVKSKHRSGICQYIANKPDRFGLKLWVFADSSSGCTYDFFIYTEKAGKNMIMSRDTMLL